MADERRRRFEALMLPHLDAALGVARWLARSDADAQDIVQEAYLRAYRSFDGFRGEQAKPWLLTIVRNCHRTLASKLRTSRVVSLEEAQSRTGEIAVNIADTVAADTEDPEAAAIRSDDHAKLNAAIARLPLDFREVLVLREFEELSYREIADIVDIPMGTVMSRLARARALLRSAWLADTADEAAS
jgi:RNA polymerase sigma-70 factor, ECF subfamily